MTILLLILGLIVAWVVAAFAANRFATPREIDEARFEPPPTAAVADGTITVATWNVGYAGMGAESDFVMDLGEQTRPLSPDLVDRNLAAIRRQIGDLGADVIFVQEAAEPSFPTYGRDVLGGLRASLSGYGWMFGPDVATRLIPPPLRTAVGNAIFSRFSAAAAERRALPLEPTYAWGAFRKLYRLHVLRLAGPEEWVLVNLHLSTFDSAEHDVRSKQVAALLDFAHAEYAAGKRVILGGDWNLRLAPTEFPHSTEDRFQFWIRDFPVGATPEGWSWAVDPSTPTVRTAHKPYVAGENYTLVIDGFLVSPNVEVEAVEALDLGFRHTDHHPVVARFRAR